MLSPAPASKLSTAITSPATHPQKIEAIHLLEGLAEHEELDLVVDGKHTSTSNTTEDVSTSTLEEGSDTLLGGNLFGSIEGRRVLNGLEEIVSAAALTRRNGDLIHTSPEVIIIRRRMVSRG